MMDSEQPIQRKLPLQKGWPLFRRFWPYLRPERKSVTLIGVLLLLGVPPAIVSPLLVRHLFDVVLPASDSRRLVEIALIMIALTLLSAGLGYARGLLSIALRNRVRFRLTAKLFAHLLRLPLRFFDKTETGYLMSRVRDDIGSLDHLMIDQLVEAVVNLLRAVIFLGLLVFLDLGLALSGVALLVVILGLVAVVSPPLRRRSEKARETDARSSATLHEALAGLFTVRSTAQRAGEQRRYGERVKRSIRAAAGRDVLGTFTGTMFGLVGTLGTYVIVAVGAYRIAIGASTFGNLFAFFLFLMQLMSSTSSVFYLVPGIQRSLASLQRLFDLFDEQRESVDTAAPETPLAPAAPWAGRPERGLILDRPLRGEVELRGVSLSYDGGPLALRGVDLVVRPGEVIALVGRSGAGKSSLVHLLPRLYDPTEGTLLLDGRPATGYYLDWLRRQIGVVPQDVFLFNRSIRDNIAYATPHATDAEIEEASRAAHAEEFITQLPEGYEAIVGERGVRLSGGQKQRLAIARELLRDPPLLILDEATSHLDAESEALVQDAIRRLLKGRTSFVIAHRLSTVHHADRIVVMDRGRIIDQGTHEQLLAKGGLYRELYELQLLRSREEAAMAEGL